jgi:hypothetical protein
MTNSLQMPMCVSRTGRPGPGAVPALTRTSKERGAHAITGVRSRRCPERERERESRGNRRCTRHRHPVPVSPTVKAPPSSLAASAELGRPKPWPLACVVNPMHEDPWSGHWAQPCRVSGRSRVRRRSTSTTGACDAWYRRLQSVAGWRTFTTCSSSGCSGRVDARRCPHGQWRLRTG